MVHHRPLPLTSPFFFPPAWKRRKLVSWWAHQRPAPHRQAHSSPSCSQSWQSPGVIRTFCTPSQPIGLTKSGVRRSTNGQYSKSLWSLGILQKPLGLCNFSCNRTIGPSEKKVGFEVEVRKAIVSTTYIKSSYSTCFFFTLFTSGHPVNMNILHGPTISPLPQIVCSCSHLIPQHHVPLEWRTWRSADPDSLLRSGPRV